MKYEQQPPILVVFGGRPGTGKTTLARKLTMRLGATYLRIDAIEQAMQAAGLTVGETGYAIANALAAENLKPGRIVIVDCVNPVLASRTGWRKTAAQNAARLVEIELVCSDPALHRRRAEDRLPDIGGHKLPAWDEIMSRDYEPWDREHLVLDTAAGTLDRLVERAEAYVRGDID
ncbi:AAA family ATPase [Bradyrhizobium liaoningense]|uniref:AAA family ATPase n=1 Tax=Bradyrhizobium liaoningense TaxID=43992 RepID=UPI001BA7A847|nr:AAA family ATPase [Bradyrhizobium liaoningense]MBR0715024.1 AAA family ATPase [Bradyrhizobium liaoningense]